MPYKDAEKERQRCRYYYQRNKEKIITQHREYRERTGFKQQYKPNPARLRLKKYGISEEQYVEMLNRQEGKCFICKKEEKTRNLSVDHCHKTGKVRALLCLNCNTALGNFRDDPELLLKAHHYLKGGYYEISKHH